MLNVKLVAFVHSLSSNYRMINDNSQKEKIAILNQLLRRPVIFVFSFSHVAKLCKTFF
ncbi:hypothetical protein BDC45DRAFT_518872 [Circinella umbellata]|nr:hypothetical protein BDC45DRAFT_518872 [Circinella umbellata]